MFYILRRKKLGKGSCTKIQQQSTNTINITRNDNIENIPQETTILRWGCTSTLPNKITKILNHSSQISLVNNKKEFRKFLQEKSLDIVPKTWFDILNTEITFPCIIRKKHHAQGKELYFCKTQQDLYYAYHNKIKQSEYYLSEYIPKIAEYRICFIQGLVAWVARKIPKTPESIAWNVNQGGKFENIHWKNWPIEVIEKAYIPYSLSGLYLSGIDMMVDKEGRSYCLEANSAPSHTSPYRIKCTTKCIDWGINNHFETLQPNTQYKKYLKWIHPALIENQQNEPTNP